MLLAGCLWVALVIQTRRLSRVRARVALHGALCVVGTLLQREMWGWEWNGAKNARPPARLPAQLTPGHPTSLPVRGAASRIHAVLPWTCNHLLAHRPAAPPCISIPLPVTPHPALLPPRPLSSALPSPTEVVPIGVTCPHLLPPAPCPPPPVPPGTTCAEVAQRREPPDVVPIVVIQPDDSLHIGSSLLRSQSGNVQ